MHSAENTMEKLVISRHTGCTYARILAQSLNLWKTLWGPIIQFAIYFDHTMEFVVCTVNIIQHGWQRHNENDARAWRAEIRHCSTRGVY
jgi:hypothetical protein